MQVKEKEDIRGISKMKTIIIERAGGRIDFLCSVLATS